MSVKMTVRLDATGHFSQLREKKTRHNKRKSKSEFEAKLDGVRKQLKSDGNGYFLRCSVLTDGCFCSANLKKKKAKKYMR